MESERIAELSNADIRIAVLRDSASGLLHQQLHDVKRGDALIAASPRDVEESLAPWIPAYTHADIEGSTLTLTGTVDTAECELVLTVPEEGTEVDVSFALRSGNARGATVAFESAFESPDFAFAPHIRPNAEDVVGRWGMKTPVGIIQKKRQMLAVIGDSTMLESAAADLPVVLEIDCARPGGRRPIIGVGIRPHELHSVAYFESSAAQAADAPRREDISLAYRLVVGLDEEPGRGYQRTARRAWELFGRDRTSEPGVQTVGFDKYAEYGFDYALTNLWQSFSDSEGERGAVTGGIKYPNDVWFQSLFNHFRSAIAFKHFGRKWGDSDIENRGDSIKRLAISAPQDARGAFPTVFTSDVKQALRVDQWYGSGHWMDSTMVEQSMGKVIERNAVKLVDWANTYHLVDCSWQCYWMLQWHTLVESDPRLVTYSQNYAEYLLGVQESDGSFPSFIDVASGRPSLTLRQNVGSAASGAFLAELYNVTGDARYLESAVRVADFIAESVLPIRKWQDYEVSFDSQGRPAGFFDRHSGQFAQTTQGMMWAAALFQRLAIAVPDGDYAPMAERIVDYLSLYQQLWNPPFLSVKTFGGFPVGNGHPAWNDARTPMIAQTLLDQYALGGRIDHLERGVAALQASLAMMFMPENESISAVAERGPIGHADEAYAGRGRDEPWCGFSYDFPVGQALTALAMAQADLGDVHVDARTGAAVGVNGCVVDGFVDDDSVISLDLRARVRHDHPLVLKMKGLEGGARRFVLNGEDLGFFKVEQLSDGIELPAAWAAA